MDNFPTLWLVAAPFVLVIGFILQALILQAACALCNVEDLRFRKAAALVLLQTVIDGPIILGFVYLAEYLGSQSGGVLLVGALWVLDLFLIWTISGFILCLLLRISFFKGLLVTVLQGIIFLVLAGVIGGLILVVLACMQLAA
jgi:hypothetical protein